ncbi:MAG: YlzJ-like family protein [Syntrophomonadaceae bacterium]|jgi:hypothetical protein
MIMYAPDPMSIIDPKAPQSMTIPLASGGHVLAENDDNNRIRIISICSTDPMDFLDPRYQPGNILTLDPTAGRLE